MFNTNDMPLEKLEQYYGTNPCPEDIYDYWKRGLEEMKNTDPDIELKPAGFKVPSAECFHLNYTGVRGARIHAKYLRPIGFHKPHPAVLLFHGYSGSSGEWCEKLKYISLGYSVAALDCRGQGGLSEDTGGVKGNTFKGHIIRGLDGDPDNLLFRHIFLDCAQLAGIIMSMPEVDQNRIGTIGGSQGGALALACAALESRISRTAVCFPFLSDYKRVCDMNLAKAAYEELNSYFRFFDPLHQREDETFTKLGYIDIQNIVRRIESKVLMGTGLMDEVCPPSTQFAVYNKILSHKKMFIYPDYGHEDLPGFNDTVIQFMLDI